MFDNIVEIYSNDHPGMRVLSSILLNKNTMKIVNMIKNKLMPYITMVKTGEISGAGANNCLTSDLFELLDFKKNTLDTDFIGVYNLRVLVENRINPDYYNYMGLEFRKDAVFAAIEFNEHRKVCCERFLYIGVIPSIMGNFKHPEVDTIMERWKLLCM